MKNMFKTVLMAAGFSVLLCSCQTSTVTCNIALPETQTIASTGKDVKSIETDANGVSKVTGSGNIYIINVKAETSKPIQVANPSVAARVDANGNQVAVNSPSSTFSKVAIPAAGAGIGAAVGGTPGAIVGAAAATTTVELIKEGTDSAKEAFSVDPAITK